MDEWEIGESLTTPTKLEEFQEKLYVKAKAQLRSVLRERRLESRRLLYLEAAAIEPAAPRALEPPQPLLSLRTRLWATRKLLATMVSVEGTLPAVGMKLPSTT